MEEVGRILNDHKISQSNAINMKKILSLFIVSMIAISAFAGPKAPPAWDKPLQKARSFTDPYVTNYAAFVIGSFNSPNYAVKIQVTFNQSAGVPYYAIVQVMGLWGGSTSASYREFTILFNSSQYYKSVNFPMAFYEEVYPATIELLDYGPQ